MSMNLGQLFLDFEFLSADQKAQFLSLHDHESVQSKALNDSIEQHPIKSMGVFKPFWRKLASTYLANTFTVGFEEDAGIGSARSHIGICLTASRFNHSCTPNVIWFFNEQTGAMTFHAMRDIPKGDQLFIAYISVSMSYEDRKRKFLNVWGCECHWPTCKEIKAQSQLGKSRVTEGYFDEAGAIFRETGARAFGDDTYTRYG